MLTAHDFRPTPRSPLARGTHTHGQPAVGVEATGRCRKPLWARDGTLWRPRSPAERTAVIDGGDRWGPTGFAKGGFGDPPLARRVGAKAHSAAAQPHRQRSWLHRQSQPFDRLRANGPRSGAAAFGPRCGHLRPAPASGRSYRLSAPDSGFFSATFATRLTKFARFRDSHRLAPACGRYADDG